MNQRCVDVNGMPALDQRKECSITSLREYVLVAQDRWEIEIYARVTGGSWQRSVRGPGETVELPSIGVRFTVDELYGAAGVR